ncbi:hypothetical protein C8Q79DRAFT_120536 [Trametes meyenii]|nr:hypothetical protein C8Q79DRAFT_120536 [Trametes meyenii]
MMHFNNPAAPPYKDSDPVVPSEQFTAQSRHDAESRPQLTNTWENPGERPIPSNSMIQIHY